MNVDVILPSGTIIPSQIGNIEIIEDISSGGGGQGIVYRARVKGRGKCALKLYNLEIDFSKMHKRINRLIEKKPDPCTFFAWPECLVEHDGRLGYVMEYVDGYKEIYELFDVEDETPVMLRLKICINICRAFRQLHEAGYSYKDINHGNILFSPNADVKIIDNDNISPNNKDEIGIFTLDYVAPELVDDKKNMPNQKTDLHSLAVLLFRCLFKSHPLKGKRFLEVSQEEEKSLYSSKNVCFIFKDKDNLDRYIDPDLPGGRDLWINYPEELREMFYKTFVDYVTSPNERFEADDWIKALIKARNSFVYYKCSCEYEDAFFCSEDIDKFECMECNKIIPMPILHIADNKGCIKSRIYLYDEREVCLYDIDPDPYDVYGDLLQPLFKIHANSHFVNIEICQNDMVRYNKHLLKQGEKLNVEDGTFIDVCEHTCVITVA